MTLYNAMDHNIPISISEHSIPPQALPTKRKNEEHYKNTIDSLERIATRQYIDNTKYQDFYRMIEGKQSLREVRELLPELSSVSLEDIDGVIPSYIKDYGLLGTCINCLVETYMLNRDKFFIKCTDPISTSERNRALTVLTQQYLKDQFNKELDELLKSKGYEVDLSLVTFTDEDEKAEYESLIADMKGELTPESIQKYITEDYRSLAAEWGEITMANDFDRFNEEDLIRENMTDLLITGKCFRHFRVRNNTYEPEVWGAMETFYSMEGNIKLPHKGEYIGKTSLYTISQVINLYGEHLPSSLLAEIQGKFYNGGMGSSSYLPPDLRNPFTLSKDSKGMIPPRSYQDREYIQNMERLTGEPLTNIIAADVCGNLNGFRGFSSPIMGSGFFGDTYSLYTYAKHKNDGRLRDDVIQVTEGYFTDYQRIGLICYENEYGTPILEEVTDELLGGMLKDLGITQITTKSRKEMEEKCEPNTITWFYRPYSRYFLKLNFDSIGVASYYYTEKLPYRIVGNHTNDVIHPVAGYIGDGVAEKIDVYNGMHNFAMNQLQDIIEKEIGRFMLFDLAYLSDRSDSANLDDNDAVSQAVNVVKALGMFGIDTSKKEFQDVVTGGQFQPIDLSLTSQISSRMQIAEFYYQKALDLIGISLGKGRGTEAYKSTEGVRIGQETMQVQTEHYNKQCSTFLREVYTIQLATAQYCQSKESTDISVSAYLNDGTEAFLQFTDPNFPIRQLGVYYVNDTKGRKQIEQVRQYFLSNNTMVNDPLLQTKILTADSLMSLLEAARESSIKANTLAEQQKERSIQVTQATEEATRQTKLFEWQLAEKSKEKDREAMREVAYANALSRAVYQKSDTSNAEYISRKLQTDFAKDKLNVDKAFKREELDLKRSSIRNREDLEARKLAIKEKDQELRDRDIRAKEFIAAANKN